MAASNGIPTTRVGEVLELVGLESVAGQRAGRFSLGMGQRLGIAAAMLGDPPVVVLDEPVNGLDPEGIRWVRTFARQLAEEGRTVFISSHLMSEMALMADHLIVIGRGTILADCSMTEFMADHASSYVRVKSPALADAESLLVGRDLDVDRVDGEPGRGPRRSGHGRAARRGRVVVHELTLVRASLEDAFMTLTADSVEYHATPPVDPTHSQERPDDHHDRPERLATESAAREPADPASAGAAHGVDQAAHRPLDAGGRSPRCRLGAGLTVLMCWGNADWLASPRPTSRPARSSPGG